MGRRLGRQVSSVALCMSGEGGGERVGVSVCLLEGRKEGEGHCYKPAISTFHCGQVKSTLPLSERVILRAYCSVGASTI